LGQASGYSQQLHCDGVESVVLRDGHLADAQGVHYPLGD